MSVKAVWLFGSRARKDQSRGSDTDLLLVGSEGKHRNVSIGHLSMFFYPWEKLLEDAQDGNLFTCHLVREAAPIYDPERFLGKLDDTFVLRRSYAAEIQQASDLGWFLDRHGSEIRPTVVVRRMTWCIRTILIARSAEAGNPVFAPEALAQLARSNEARELLVERRQRRADATMRQKFRLFLMKEAMPLPFEEICSVSQFEERFCMSGNRVGLQTISSRANAAEHAGPYEAG
jgi:hypothetical protein